MWKYGTKSEVHLILWWKSDDQVFRLVFGRPHATCHSGKRILSGQYLEPTRNSVWPKFWPSVSYFFLFPARHEHNCIPSAALVYIRYLQRATWFTIVLGNGNLEERLNDSWRFHRFYAGIHVCTICGRIIPSTITILEYRLIVFLRWNSYRTTNLVCVSYVLGNNPSHF